MTRLSLRQARKEQKLTQTELAKKLGVTKRTIVAWESGEVAVRPYVIYALAYLYGIDADQIEATSQH